MNLLKELLRPWKLATLAMGLALLTVGRYYFQAPDWDIPMSVIMALVAYATASWSMHVMVERQWKMWPLMLVVTWFAVDGCYWLYWRWQNPAALEMMREVNAPASLTLYWMCGLAWYFRGTAKQFTEILQIQLRRL